ncbi:MAG TPA: GDYXXLXY domain-containing protein [Leptolyngbyaceae cyanobacterium]
MNSSDPLKSDPLQSDALRISPQEIPPTPTPELQTAPEKLHKQVPAWRFWTPLVIQMALLVSVPAQSAYTYATGQTVVLQTRPVDPYDFLRGYSQTLSYDVSDVSVLSKLPGGKVVFEAGPPPSSFYVVLQKPNSSADPRPTAWKPVSVSADRPTQLTADQVALRGQMTQSGQIRYGLESYYMPEDRRDELNQAIGQAQQQPESFVVEVKVDKRGYAVPISLWVKQQNYRF